ncbi:HNH endonuclease [Aeromonas caviae]|uniref:HNH endonuclease n=1 Tax=Aeromonas caviae TaxID=648 RepID=UPI0029057BD3|nr:HNH endonuclease signature motif containing protein [Aeromonas caviae]
MLAPCSNAISSGRNLSGVCMPPRRMKPCRHPGGCAALTNDKSGRCEAHRVSGWAVYQAGLSRHQRGYGSEWDKLRQVILVRDGYLCLTCLALGIYTPATTVDHVVAKAHGGTDDPSNLASICDPCHGVKTAKERLKGRQT